MRKVDLIELINTKGVITIPESTPLIIRENKREYRVHEFGVDENGEYITYTMNGIQMNGEWIEFDDERLSISNIRDLSPEFISQIKIHRG